MRREQGVTLVELMVVVALAGAVLGMVTTALIQSQRTAAGTFQRQADLGEARIAADAASADLRTLTPLSNSYLVTATGQEVTFFARRDLNVDAPPVRVRLVLESNGDLVRYSTRMRPGGSATPAPADYDNAALTQATQRRVLASGLQPAQTVFRYYASYSLVAVAPSPAVSPRASELPMAVPSGGGAPAVPTLDRQSVRFIEVRLTVDQGNARVGGTSVRQLVRLPNA